MCATAALAASLLAYGGCGRQSAQPQPPAPAPKPLHEWPRGYAPPVKIDADLTLSIPLEYERSAVEPGPRAGAPVAAPAPSAGEHREAHFDFFLPGFGGYTLANYRNDADPDRVEVLYVHAGNPHEGDPDAPGEYPPNMLKRSLQQGLIDPESVQDRYGLSCYRSQAFTGRITCFGRREPAGGEDIMLTLGVSVPEMQARYFSRRYGGVRVAWRSDVQNLPQWRAIDAQVWKFIAAWQVAPPAVPGPQQPLSRN